MQSTEFLITDQGYLRITLTAQGKLDLERLLNRHPDWNDTEILLELIDYQLNHGWYIVPAEQVRAQTQSIILTESTTYDDQGNLVMTGDVFWYPQHGLESYTTGLSKRSYIVFEKGE